MSECPIELALTHEFSYSYRIGAFAEWWSTSLSDVNCHAMLGVEGRPALIIRRSTVAQHMRVTVREMCFCRRRDTVRVLVAQVVDVDLAV